MRAVVISLLIAGVSSAQVQSAADAGAGVYSSLLAPGSLAVINYTQTANSVASATVSLLPANAGAPIPAQVTSVTPNAITFIVPAGAPAGSAQLIYKPGTQITQWTPVVIVPAILSLFRTGQPGPLVAANFFSNGSANENSLETPAQPGQAIVLWGTGLGSTPQSAVQITLGGVAQTVFYAGIAPGQPGINQINFRISSGTPDGCYVPLTVTYGTQSLTSFLSKTSDGLPCHHPFQLSVDAVRLLDSGSSIQANGILLTTGIVAPAPDRASRQESAQVQFLSLNASQMANYFIGAASGTSQPCIAAPQGSFPGNPFPSTGPVSMTLKNATSTLALPWTAPPQTDSPLISLPPPIIAAGPWTWSTPGGSALSASSFGFVLPPPVQIAGGAPLTLNRSQSQTITWNGSGFDSSATVQLSLTAQYPGSPSLTCSVPAQAGSVTLPSNLLTQFNAGSIGVLSVSAGEAGLGIPHAQFNLLNNGGPFLMLVTWSSTDARPVDFQ